MGNWLFVFLAVLMMATAANAVTISAPSEIPVNINWSFSIELDATDSFDYSHIMFDGRTIATAYSNGKVIGDAYNDRFVINAFTVDTDAGSTTGLVLYISHMGLEEGTHTITARSYNNDAMIDESVSEVIAFVTLTEDAFSETGDEIEHLQGLVDSLKDMLNEYDESLADKEKRVETLEKIADDLKNSIMSVKAMLEGENGLEQEVADLEDSLENVQAALARQSGRLDDVEGKGEGFFAAFAGFGSNYGLGLLLIVIVVVIVAAFLYLRNHSFSAPRWEFGGKDSGKEAGLETFESGGKHEAPKREKKDAVPEHAGKWAMKGGKWKPKSEKKFSFKDLLKKNN